MIRSSEQAVNSGRNAIRVSAVLRSGMISESEIQAGTSDWRKQEHRLSTKFALFNLEMNLHQLVMVTSCNLQVITYNRERPNSNSLLSV